MRSVARADGSRMLAGMQAPDATLAPDGTLSLSGAWTLGVAARMPEVFPEATRSVDLSRLEDLDAAGAWAIVRRTRALGGDVPLTGVPDASQGLFALVAGLSCATPAKAAPEAPWHVVLSHLGAGAVHAWQQGLQLLSFGGHIVVAFTRGIRHPKMWRLPSLARHIEQTGIDAIPIIALISFLISIVLAYQGATQLRQFGAQIFTVDLVAVSVLREMGVLLTAIMVAGRSGSAFTAELGAMNVNEEIDALRTFGLDPVQVLVLPRLIALLIVLPLLTFLSDIVGLLGGAVTAMFLLDISWAQYVGRVRDAVDASTFWVGIVKAPFFAFLIALVGCRRGMGVKRSAVSLGEQTTLSVVESIFLVMLADALFSILFSELGV